MRKTFLLFTFSLAVATIIAQVQSPEKFLGYALGSRFTPHWKLVNYFNHVAQQARDVAQVHQYGVTNEGRPLIVTFISAAGNIKRLEEIRENNLRLANLGSSNVQPDLNAPAIVWLSYNVHGNEASSSEAAMLTLFALVDPSNAGTKEWLKNTVVVIDPCINPDGRDRYVNWFTSIAGKQFNPDPQSREHIESWPYGRTNHYYFDLNRDWAWQVQLESQQRVKLYNEWLPQVHADFHEQYYNNPYYFAPAAEPYHEVITPWQKEYQTMLGRNNAKYFDQKGWLYFTKGGGFDLFYPSYGDTYPTFHGAIGMTYEQGGGGAGALAVITEDGDTLTLEDRLTHHHTTSLSTIEISSQNAARLVKEFRKFYSDALAKPAGEYITYLIKRRSTSAALETVINRYLRNNGISYGYAQSKETLRGFNYISGKDEPVTIEENDILISAYQPKSVMLKVLFEPRSKQGEVLSRPYDITAWSLPYALGLEAYAIKQAAKQKMLPPSPDQHRSRDSIGNRNGRRNAYAYVIPWKHLSSARVLARLLQTGVRVRYHEQPFSVNGKDFDAGTLIITKAANSRFGDRLFDTVHQAAVSNGDLHPVESVFTGFVDKGVDLGGSKVRVIQPPRVALMGGESTDVNAFGAIWHFFEQQLNYPVSLLYANDFGRIDWRKYNVIIIPNGNYRFITDKVFNEQLKSWVRQGGKLIAMEGSVNQLANAEWGIKSKEEDKKKKETEEEKDPYLPVKKYDNRTRDDLISLNSGTIYKVQLDNSHPLGYGYPDYYFTLKQDNAVYEFIREGGWNVGILKKDNYISGFLGSKAQEKLKDGLLFGVQEMGRGSVVYLADDVLFRGFWENGKLLFCNAVFMVGQ
ncbi:MAG: M14 metallopeptidase family protein [Chitinophagaceae bacterium]